MTFLAGAQSAAAADAHVATFTASAYVPGFINSATMTFNKVAAIENPRPCDS